MAEEIKIPCRVWPSRNANQNAYYDHFVETNNNYISEGLRCPDAVDSDLFFRMTAPIPAAINSTTPAGKIRVTYIPQGASGDVRFITDIHSLSAGSTNIDPAAMDDTDTTNDTVTTADVEKEMTVTLNSTINQAAGRVLVGKIQRNAANAADTHGADIGIVQVLYVGDD